MRQIFISFFLITILLYCTLNREKIKIHKVLSVIIVDANFILVAGKKTIYPPYRSCTIKVWEYQNLYIFFKFQWVFLYFTQKHCNVPSHQLQCKHGLKVLQWWWGVEGEGFVSTILWQWDFIIKLHIQQSVWNCKILNHFLQQNLTALRIYICDIICQFVFEEMKTHEGIYGNLKIHKWSMLKKTIT